VSAHHTPMLRALAASIRAGVPALLWGNPGTGKPHVSQPWLMVGSGTPRSSSAPSASRPTSSASASKSTAAPAKVGHVAYAPPGWARAASKADRALVFFDELTTAPPSVRKAMLHVLQERVVGDLQLPDTVAIVAAANPPESAVDGYDLEPPMANRLLHLEFTFPLDSWLDGFVSGFDNIIQPSMTDLIGRGDDQHRASTRAAVAAFHKSRPDLIEPGVPDDPTKAGRAWPSRRSWDNAARVLCELRPGDDDGTVLVLKGTVGDGPANEFLAFQRDLDLPDPLDVIAHPTRYDWSGMRPDKAFATVNAVRAYVLGTTPDKTLWLGAVNALSTVAEAGLLDIAQGAVAALLTNMPDGVGVPRRVRRVRRAVCRHRPLGRMTEPSNGTASAHPPPFAAESDAVAQSLATPQMGRLRSGADFVLCRGADPPSTTDDSDTLICTPRQGSGGDA
jgi:hypothetical protein